MKIGLPVKRSSRQPDSALTDKRIMMMFKKTLLATATAGLIAAGALTVTTGSATAHQTGYNTGNSGFSFGYNVKPRRNCKPIFQRVRLRDRWGRTHWRRVQVGQNCQRVQQRRYRPRQGLPGNFGRHRNNNGFSFQFGW
ncbi:MAG: hypothetical protein ACTSU0_08280 [Alphaproteobacteria bacterium]